MSVRKQIVKRIVQEQSRKKLSKHGLDNLLPPIYASRGVASLDDIHYTLKNLVPFASLKGVTDAAKHIANAMEEDESIVIVGDFDVDGATATAVVYSALELFGYSKINFVVPDRFKYSYGLSTGIIDVAVEKYNPKLLITVDSGVKDIQGVEYANSLGIKVVVTDHHMPDAELPQAAAIVNPNLPINADFPCKSMAGVGVAFYTMLGLRAELRDRDWFMLRDINDPNMAELLDLVALGTVADVVELDRNNRLMVFQGILRIKKNKARVGIKALFAVSQKSCSDASAQDLSFALAPHLNAAGRLADMEIGIKILISHDPIQSDIYADKLHDLNLERKQIEMTMQKEALSIVDSLEIQNKSFSSLCLYQESWHQGVAGILASRLKEKYSCPVVILTNHSDKELKGSARSIPGIDVRAILAKVANLHPNVVLKHGGHKNAAGLTIVKDQLELFKSAFEEIVNSESVLDKGVELLTDGVLPAGRINLNTAYMLKDAGPWGQGFPEPVFEGEFSLLDHRVVGQKHLKMSLKVQNCYEIINAIHFNADLKVWPNSQCETVRIVYRLDINEFRGSKHLQLVVLYLEDATKVRSNKPQEIALEID